LFFSQPPSRSVSRILAVDPGTRESGWVLLDAGAVAASGVSLNCDLLPKIRDGMGAELFALEMVASMGMPVGQEVFETVRWIGRFQQCWREPEEVILVYRHQVKTALCGSQRAKDANVRQALLDIFPASGGGAVPQIGTKSRPGPLYGVRSHAWSALAVAVTLCLRHKLFSALPCLPQREMLP